jgi:hypothetical protein
MQLGGGFTQGVMHPPRTPPNEQGTLFAGHAPPSGGSKHASLPPQLHGCSQYCEGEHVALPHAKGPPTGSGTQHAALGSVPALGHESSAAPS